MKAVKLIVAIAVSCVAVAFNSPRCFAEQVTGEPALRWRSLSIATMFRSSSPVFTGKINKLTFKLEPEPKAATKR
jgi:hypothetical protein